MKFNGNTHGSHEGGAGNNKKNNKREIEKTPRTGGEGNGKKGGRALRRALTVVGVIVVVVLAVIAAYSIWEKPPAFVDDLISSTPKPSSSDSSATVSVIGGEEDDDIAAEPLKTERNDGVYTVLLVGRDKASNSTDTIIVGKFDTVNHTIDCVNIPRDTLINISWANTPKKINAVYPGFTNSGKSGIEGLSTHLKNILGFGIDCYVVVSLEAVEQTVDAIGGVYFDVPCDMDYDDPLQHFHVHLKQGYQLLNGYETLGAFRYRYAGDVNGSSGSGYAGGDLDRIQVQQSLLKAIASQMLSLGNIPNLSNVIQILVDNVETNLTAANMAYFARQFLKCSMDGISFHVAPTSSSCINGGSFVSLKNDEWLQMVNDYLNPYAEDVTLANVNILNSLNYDGTSLSSTTGTIAGGPDSFYCWPCTGNDHGIVHYHAPGACPPAVTEPVETDAPETDTPSGGEATGDGETGTTPAEPEAPVVTTEPAENAFSNAA